MYQMQKKEKKTTKIDLLSSASTSFSVSDFCRIPQSIALQRFADFCHCLHVAFIGIIIIWFWHKYDLLELWNTYRFSHGSHKQTNNNNKN